MNKIVSKLYIALLATLVTLLSACTPETYELGSQDIVSDDLAEGIAFSITHDAFKLSGMLGTSARTESECGS